MERTSNLLESQTPVLCRVSDVARRLSISRSSLYQLMDSGKLAHVKLGRSRRIKWSDVLAFVDANTVGGQGLVPSTSN
jgi:excisionase family DNA binding protein